MRAVAGRRRGWMPIGRAIRIACARAELRGLMRRFDGLSWPSNDLPGSHSWTRNTRILARISYLEARIAQLARA